MFFFFLELKNIYSRVHFSLSARDEVHLSIYFSRECRGVNFQRVKVYTSLCAVRCLSLPWANAPADSNVNTRVPIKSF